MKKSVSMVWLLLAAVAILACPSCKHTSKEQQWEQLVRKGRPELLRLYEAAPDQFHGKDLYIVGRCYSDEGRFEEAKRLFTRYTESTPDDPKGWHALGNAFALLNQWTEAVPCFERADSMGKPEALRMLAASYAGAGEFRKVRDLAPRLEKYVATLPEGADERYEMIGIAITAALGVEPDDRALFERLIRFLPADSSRWRQDVKECAIKGFERFGTPARIALPK
jgi:tetratricopeptide (TPR) repeat protein